MEDAQESIVERKWEGFCHNQRKATFLRAFDVDAEALQELAGNEEVCSHTTEKFNGWPCGKNFVTVALFRETTGSTQSFMGLM